MTTELVVSITDELVAELEALADNAIIARSGNPWFTQDDCCWWTGNVGEGDFISALTPHTIVALLSERAELKRDAERYRLLRDACDPTKKRSTLVPRITDPLDFMVTYYPEGLDAALDQAMQDSQE